RGGNASFSWGRSEGLRTSNVRGRPESSVAARRRTDRVLLPRKEEPVVGGGHSHSGQGKHGGDEVSRSAAGTGHWYLVPGFPRQSPTSDCTTESWPFRDASEVKSCSRLSCALRLMRVSSQFLGFFGASAVSGGRSADFVVVLSQCHY